MEKCYMYQTSIGPFYIVEHQNGYHAIYAGVTIGECPSANELAAVLGYGYKFILVNAGPDEIDTSGLKIPAELSDWTRCYFMPSNLRGDFKHISELKFQETAY